MVTHGPIIVQYESVEFRLPIPLTQLRESSSSCRDCRDRSDPHDFFFRIMAVDLKSSSLDAEKHSGDKYVDRIPDTRSSGINAYRLSVAPNQFENRDLQLHPGRRS